jgi:hypothetical protein
MTTKTVWKYAIPLAEEFEIEMPQGAHVLTVQDQLGTYVLWALVDPTHTPRRRRFWLAGTGRQIPMAENLSYVATIQLHGGELVFHLFERVRGG